MRGRGNKTYMGAKNRRRMEENGEELFAVLEKTNNNDTG